MLAWFSKHEFLYWEHTGLLILVNCHSSSCIGSVLLTEGLFWAKRLFQLKLSTHLQITLKLCVCTPLCIMATFDSHEYSELWNSKYRLTVQSSQSLHKVLTPRTQKKSTNWTCYKEGAPTPFWMAHSRRGRLGIAFPWERYLTKAQGHSQFSLRLDLRKKKSQADCWPMWLGGKKFVNSFWHST